MINGDFNPGQDSRTSINDHCIGGGLPPIPPKLVCRTESGEFIDMCELLPEHLGMGIPDNLVS